MHFSLRKLFLATGLAGLAAAGMATRTRWWVDGFCLFTIVLFVAAAIRAIVATGRERAVLIAFSGVGAAYLLLSTCVGFSPLRGALPSNYALAMAALLVKVPMDTGFHDVTIMDAAGNVDPQATAAAISPKFSDYLERSTIPDFASAIRPTPIDAFFLIGHCVAALLAGWVASIYCRFLLKRMPKPTVAEP